MATDFGALEEFMADDGDVMFTFRGETYHETFGFAQVANMKAFQAQLNQRIRDKDVTEEEAAAVQFLSVAKLFGCDFDVHEWRFKRLPKDHFINRLIDAGANYDVIERIVNGIWAKYQYGDDVAVTFMKTLDVGKAIEAMIKQRIVENPDQETPTGTGETDADDSETPKD